MSNTDIAGRLDQLASGGFASGENGSARRTASRGLRRDRGPAGARGASRPPVAGGRGQARWPASCRTDVGPAARRAGRRLRSHGRRSRARSSREVSGDRRCGRWLAEDAIRPVETTGSWIFPRDPKLSPRACRPRSVAHLVRGSASRAPGQLLPAGAISLSDDRRRDSPRSRPARGSTRPSRRWRRRPAACRARNTSAAARCVIWPPWDARRAATLRSLCAQGRHRALRRPAYEQFMSVGPYRSAQRRLS